MNLFEKIEQELKQLKRELTDRETIHKRIQDYLSENEGKPVSLADISQTCKKMVELPEYLSNKEFDDILDISNVRKKASELSSLLSRKITSRNNNLENEILAEAENLFKLVSEDTEEIWGIYDKQKGEWREEEYSSYKEALHGFAEYWKEIVFSDVHETFDFEEYKSQNRITHELSQQEETKIIQDYLDDWDDKEFLDWYEMEVKLFLPAKSL